MRRWLLVGLVLLAALAAVDLAVAQVRGAPPFVPLWGVIARPRPPIVVGLIHSQTGPLTINEKSLLDAEVMALEEINAGGGVAGRRLVWEIADGRSDPSTFASQALRLIEKDKAEVLVGGWTAECRKAMLAVVEERQGLLIFPANFEGIEASTHVLYSGGSANQVVLPAVRWCSDVLKARKFFVAGNEEVWSRVVSELAKDAIKAAGGVLAGESYVPLAGGDATALAESIRAAGPDVVLNVMVGEFNVPFFSAFKRAGLTAEKLPVVSFCIAEDELKRFQAGDVTGHYAAWNYFQGIDRPANLDFVRRFKARPGSPGVVSDPMVAARNGLLLWAKAANEAGTAEPAAVLDRLDRYSLDAPEGIVSIDPGTRVAWRPFHLGKARADGQFDVVWSMTKPNQPVTYVATRSRQRWRALLDELTARWGGRWSSSEPVHPDPTRPPN